MITLKPSWRIKKLQPQINFHTLGLVCSIITSRSDKISIRICNSNISFYPQTHSSNSAIYMSHALTEKRLFLQHFFHEFRHYLQDKIFKIDFSDSKYFTDIKFKDYTNSPVEVDARHFEKGIGLKAIRLYETLENKRRIFKSLGDFKRN